jgi:hypothetical protein
VVLVIGAAHPAWAQHSIDWFTIGGGGAMSSSGTYTVEGTIGQPFAGGVSGGAFTLGAGFWRSSGTTVDSGDDTEGLPLAFRLGAPTPNPLMHHTVVAFDLAHSGPIRLRLYDAAGRVVRTIDDAALPAGRYQRVWDGTNDDGQRVAAGIYFLLLDAGHVHVKRKVAVVR